jgi:hypothetical protein
MHPVNPTPAPKLGKCDLCPTPATVVWPASPVCPQLNGRRTCDECSLTFYPLLLGAARRTSPPRQLTPKRPKSGRAASRTAHALAHV